MPYWHLFQRENGRWEPVFGSRDKADVDFERDDVASGYPRVKRADLKIVRFARVPTQRQVMLAAANLHARQVVRRNPAARPKRGKASGRPYIVKEGRKIYFASLAAAGRAAQRLADALGRRVRVRSD